MNYSESAGPISSDEAFEASIKADDDQSPPNYQQKGAKKRSAENIQEYLTASEIKKSRKLSDSE